MARRMYTEDEIQDMTAGGGTLYKHDCKIGSIGPDSGYFTGQLVIINDSSETIDINNETAMQAISAFGEINDGPGGYTLESGVIGITVRRISNKDQACLVAKPSGADNIYYHTFDFSDHTNYSVEDRITALTAE